MPLAVTYSVALVGIKAFVVEVELDVANGLPGFTLTALSDRVLKQVEHRVRAAVTNSGVAWPARRTTVALSPAGVPKSGSGFDLPIAAAVLAAAGEVPAEPLRDLVLLGECALSGDIRPVAGVLPAVIGGVRAGRRKFVVPRRNGAEARLVPGADVVAVGSLRELIGWLRGEISDDALAADAADVIDEPPAAAEPRDLEDVLGQPLGRLAIEVAAAGGHHLMLKGSPGVGKTMLAERLPGILPPLESEDAMEVTAIHSVAGLIAPGRPLITTPPFFAPHHSATLASVVGGGAGIAQPGAISLSHRGVLFLDEAPEFHPRVLDALRQPLESGRVTLARAGGIVDYAARFQLVLAANPCPCSAAGRDTTKAGCICPPAVRMRYQSRLSGPLVDRLDINVELESVSRLELAEDARGETSAVVRERVFAARERARHRFVGTPWQTTAEVPGPLLRRHWPAHQTAMLALRRLVARSLLSNRGLDRVLKVAWTLADLAGRDRPGESDIALAIELRRGDQQSNPHAVSA